MRMRFKRQAVSETRKEEREFNKKKKNRVDNSEHTHPQNRIEIQVF
jgi:hypothetical protein